MTSLPPPIQAVVALFRGPLEGVRFGDVDAKGLSSLATEVETAIAEIEAQEAKLAELKQTMAQRADALATLAQQALAYARIYAENDEALTAELSQIVLPRVTKPKKASGKVAAEAAPAETAAPSKSETSGETPEPVEVEAAEAEAEPEAAEAKPRLMEKPKKRYSRVPPQSRAS